MLDNLPASTEGALTFLHFHPRELALRGTVDLEATMAVCRDALRVADWHSRSPLHTPIPSLPQSMTAPKLLNPGQPIAACQQSPPLPLSPLTPPLLHGLKAPDSNPVSTQIPSPMFVPPSFQLCHSRPFLDDRTLIQGTVLGFRTLIPSLRGSS
jgi:hypothetical protein